MGQDPIQDHLPRYGERTAGPALWSRGRTRVPSWPRASGASTCSNSRRSRRTAGSRYLFTDVSVPAGIARTGVRFGQPGNTSFANGVAVVTRMGTGCSTCSSLDDRGIRCSCRRTRGPLRHPARSNLEWRSLPAARAPSSSTSTTTATRTWPSPTSAGAIRTGVGGNPLRLYVNDGRAQFTERGPSWASTLCDGYSLAVLDFDADGWLDLYVPTMAASKPTRTTRGGRTQRLPDRLLPQRGGKRFEDSPSELD